MTTTAEKHTPTPICYELALPTGTAITYDIFHAKNSVGATISGDAADDPYGDEERDVIAFVGDVWGDHAKEWAALITASVNAFHSPTRTIATEQITEGLFWRMYDGLKVLQEHIDSLESDAARGLLADPNWHWFNEVRAILSSLKIEEDHDRQP